MERRNNYVIQAQQAKQYFLGYDQPKLIRKLLMQNDEKFLYTRMLGETYRISRQTGDVERKKGENWVDANSFNEVLTLFDLVCDSREDRCLAGRFQNMSAFGLQFHQNLNETDPRAQYLLDHAPDVRRACEALGGKPFPLGDLAYTIEVFDGMSMVLQLWEGDEDFPAGLHFLWDENAKMYIKYETMYYCVGLLMSRIEDYIRR